MREPRMSAPTLLVLRHLLLSPDPETSGASISKTTGVSAGTLYPLLARLERADWATSRWEEIDPREAGRPRRRFYTLTESGTGAARRHLAVLQLPTTSDPGSALRRIAGTFNELVRRIRPAGLVHGAPA